ncbi:MAG: hypothetical protein WAU49_18165, partial [Steroidobacteraceae bacterium]
MSVSRGPIGLPRRSSDAHTYAAMLMASSSALISPPPVLTTGDRIEHSRICRLPCHARDTRRDSHCYVRAAGARAAS